MTQSSILLACGAEADTGTLLLHNTAWTRDLYDKIRAMIDSRAVLKVVCGYSSRWMGFGCIGRIRTYAQMATAHAGTPKMAGETGFLARRKLS